MSQRRRHRALRVGLVIVLLLSGAGNLERINAVSDPSAGHLDDTPSTTPSDLGDVDLTELQYGDPAEALDLIQPPQANVEGSASVAHPLAVPPGRAGVQPDLALTYDSNGGSGWVGTGWDLSVGAITVDTTFGAPRYLPNHESETYLLDGDRLFPNAIRTDLEARHDGPRSDWVRQVEDTHELIIRHGDRPSDYCWEVVDKEGTHRWYGGEPAEDGGCDRDETAVLTAPNTGVSGAAGGDYHWPLTYVEDISGNVMRYRYDTPENVEIGRGSNLGVSHYLRTITYTGFSTFGDLADEPAYQIDFLRDGHVAGETARKDVTVDASTGEPVVTRDLLRRIEVSHLSPEYYDAGVPPEPIKGWTLEYENGPFDKALLTRIGQFGTDGAGSEHAWHEFTWFNDVQNSSGDYEGFGPAEQWGSGAGDVSVNLAAESALGTSWRAGGDGGSYIGFNPVKPSKNGSFGGSFNVAVGHSTDVSTLVDLDGDGLADKVWASSSGAVMYSRNLRRPGGSPQPDGTWFGASQPITSLNSVGQSTDLRIDVHFEAYPAVAIQVGGGFGFSFGDQYFEDVNGDGRVDFIKPGSGGAHTVFYNVLVDGIPTFIDSALASELTDKLEVPLDGFDSDLASADIEEVTQLLLNTSPRIDTVRRWLAPHTGTIRVEGSPALTAGAAYRGDGALTTIEHDATQLWTATLDASTTGTTHDVEVDVTAGQPVWFRVHVIDNAADDEVSWDPTITYTDLAGGVAAGDASPDANGRSQVVFDSSDDFTLFGRTGARTSLTEPGETTIDVTVTTVDEISDDLDVFVLHGRGDDDPTRHDLMTVDHDDPLGPTSGSVEVTVTEPSTNPGPDGTLGTRDDFEESDYIEVHVVSDSPVDPTSFSIDASTTHPDFEPPDTSVIPPEAEVDFPLDIPVVPNVRVFARTDHSSPYVPATSPDENDLGAATASIAVAGLPLTTDPDEAETWSSPAVLTVKTLDGGVVARSEFTVAHLITNPPLPAPRIVVGLGGEATVDFDPEPDTEYYIDVSVADPVFGEVVDLTSSTVTWRWTDSESAAQSTTVDDAGQLHWPDADGMFPSANRGWATAGYNADHAGADGAGPLVETQFRFAAESAGHDEDTDVPTADDAPSAGDVKADVQNRFDPALPYIPWGAPGNDVADRWRAAEKESLNATATTMQSDRLGADTALPGLTTDGREAPQMLSLNGDFNFMLGLVASFTAAIGGGRELKGYEDYNGDGFPDIRNGADIEYTGPRGAKATTTSAGDDPFDTSFALGGGIDGSAVAISSSGSSSKNNDGGGEGSNVEPTSTKSSRGMNIGLGFDINTQWTNPLADVDTGVGGGGSDAPDIQGDHEADRGADAPMDRALIDVNGDGLPDRVETEADGDVYVHLNLGYRFAGDAIHWSTGRTSFNQDVGGGVSIGFQLNAYEFAGGISYSESVGYSLFDWHDIDGDGVPDRMSNEGGADPATVFGSGDGMESGTITYGDFPDGEVNPVVQFDGNGIPLPDGQMEVSRSTGLTGGVDFSFYIGPICKVACYIVVNPGVHGGYDRMTSQVSMADMNGDGYLDAVKSTDSDDIEVRLNQHGRTNLLQSATNPLGGQLRLDYERTGNTIDNPESLWVMSTVEFDDGRHGDGVSVQRSNFSYDGNAYDPLLRDLMGFSSIREDQLDADGTVLRSFESDYLNGNPFETGTMIEERTLNAAGEVVTASTFDWLFTNADPNHPEYGIPVVDVPERSTTARLQLFDMALSPRLVTDQLMSWDDGGRDDPAAQSQRATTHYTYNVIGDVVTVHEENEHEVDADDTFTVLTYPPCADRSGARDLGPDDTWVSVPQTVTVYGNDEASGERLKHRNGGPDLCGNAAPIRISELVSEGSGTCGPLFAITELSFDGHGSYNSVARPSNAVPASCDQYPPETIDSADVTYDGCDTLSADDDATRYCVDYVYDQHRFTDIATVTDNHGVSSSATYDPRTGRQASRTDENGNLTTFTYDPQGRLSTITAPREQGGGTPTLSFAYGGLDATLDPAGAHAWSTARHHDIFNPDTTIDTITFVDGMGRVVQRKRDAEVDGVDGESRIVEGAIDYDALGREVREWYPVVETDADFSPTTYNTWNSQTGPGVAHVPATEPIQRQYTTLDSLRFQQLPDGSVETIDYDFEVLPDPAGTYSAPITMQRVTFTDPLGKESTQWRDVGGATFRREDKPIGANAPDGSGGPLASLPGPDVLVDPRIADSTGTPGAIITDYEYDRLGRLTAVIDAAGARTEHTYSRADAVTSTDTPDAGLVQRSFAPSGHLLTVERANGTVATYTYDRDRLVGLAYSDDTPDVSYEYGSPNAAENAAGRVTMTVDGAMARTLGYDVDGNVARETATMDEDPFGKGVDDDPPTWETTWTYDSLGRIDTLTYPSGEELHHDYDLGGRPSRLASQAPQHDLYDQYGTTVPRDDVDIVYLDEIRYDQFGEVTYLRTGTGVETRYEREPTRRFLAEIATDSTATEQFDGTTSPSRPLQRLEYNYDAVGNVRDVANRLYERNNDSAVTDLGPPPENNVPGPSQQAYTYDGHYRLVGAVGTYVDRKENRDFTFETDYAANGNLLSKRQVTTTTSTTSSGRGKDRNPNAKKGSGTGTSAGTTPEPTCESDTGSGGGSFNQDPETTYVLAPGDMEYATDAQGASIHQLVRAGTRDYTYDDNGNMTGWIQDCAEGTADISRTLEWDAENRLTRIAEDNNDTDYRYNAEGARTLERGPGGTTWFVNEHWRTFNDGLYYASIYLGEQRVAIHRTDPQPPPPAPCTDTTDVTCPLDGGDAWIGGSQAECPAPRVFDADTSTCQPRETRKLYFLHADLQGSMRVATDEVGNVHQYMEYLPTGRPWVAGQDTTKDTPFLFAGGWTDPTYDLINFGARWYDAREQNFVTPDPILEEDPSVTVDDPSLLSAYTYASSNPLRYVDPDGRASTAAGGNRFDVGTNHEKHQAGHIRISPALRAKIDAPAITFRGRYSNNANGQKLFAAFEKHKDRADRFTTVLSISTEDGVRKIRVFGITTSKKDVGTSPAPNPSPGNSGASPGQGAATPPAVNTGAPPPSAASTPPGSTSTTPGGASSASAATTAAPSARSGAVTASPTGTGTTASTSPQPSRPPANNSPRAPGPSG